jgi:SAM-dependent methyltransferase
MRRRLPEPSDLEDWYYTVEIAPGRFTRGKEYPNVALTRALLRRCEVAGRRCLDIGTMEALVPVLLERRRAAETTAVDVLDLSRRVELVKAVYDVDFAYVGRLASADVLPFLRRRWQRRFLGRRRRFGFDIVVVSGILYHVFSPMHLLGTARTCVRDGGLMILETAAVRSSGYRMDYNFNGSEYIYGWTDIWFPSVPLLDYLLRLFRLQPIDCVHLESSDPGFPHILRIGVACRAVPRHFARPAEALMVESTRNFEFGRLVQYDTSAVDDPVVYRAPAGLPQHGDVEACDLFACTTEREPLLFTRHDLILTLDAGS